MDSYSAKQSSLVTANRGKKQWAISAHLLFLALKLDPSLYLALRARRWLRIAKWRRVAACAVHAGGVLYLQTICVCHCRTTMRRGHTAECWVPRQLSDTADNIGQAWGRKRPPVDLLLSSISHARQLTFSPRTQLSRMSALARVGYGGMYPGRGQMSSTSSDDAGAYSHAPLNM